MTTTIDVSKEPGAVAELTDIITTEVSLVDRAANMRSFVVKKAQRPDGEAPAINPLLDVDPAIAAKDKAEAEEYRLQKAALEAGTVVAEVAATPPTVVETPVVAEAPVVETVAAPPVVVEAPVVAPPVVAETVTKENDSKAAGSSFEKNPAGEPDNVSAGKKKEVKKDDGGEEAPVVISVSLTPPAPEALKIIPQLKAALEAGLQAVVARAQDALKVLSASVVDSAGYSYTPYEVSAQVRQIDALVDQMEYMGGTDWAASAILAAGAASAPTDVSKAGAAMSAARHSKFTKVHGDMGASFKEMTKCYKAMGDMLGELAPGDKTAKSEEAPVVVPAPVPAPASAPAPVVVPDVVIPPTTVNKSADDIDLRKMVEDLRRTVQSQAQIIEKAQEPRQSNAIPLATTMPNSGTINAEGTHWPADMAPSNKKSSAGKF
jgi:hypothetical protein